LRVLKVQRPCVGCHKTDNPLAHPKAGQVNRFLGQTTGRKQFQHFARTHDIDRAHLSHHIGSNDGHDLAKSFFSSPRSSHNVSDAL